MNSRSLRDSIQSAWNKLTPHHKVFLSLLQTQLEEFNSEYGLKFRTDKITLAELFLTLVYREFDERHKHEVDILAALSDNTNQCRSTNCVLFSTAINSVLQELELFTYLDPNEQHALANISQLMCMECIRGKPKDLSISASNQIDITVLP